MKKIQKSKLMLNVQTVRTLSTNELGHVGGGANRLCTNAASGCTTGNTLSDTCQSDTQQLSANCQAG